MAEQRHITYRTMRCSLPEGGEVVLHIPSHIGSESLDMAAKCIELQMRIFKRHAEARESVDCQERADDAPPPRSGH